MFGGGGVGFGTTGSGFGTSAPFGTSTAGQQTSAFGTGGATFGSSTSTAFGAKPTFGTTTTSSFGNTAFGAKPSVFGAPAPAPGAGVFGGATAGTSAFGRTASTSPFGATTAAPAATGAFGATTTGAFGAPAPTAGPFGAPATVASTLGGSFGSSTSATNPFGKPASSPFGAPAPAPAAGGVFGAAPATGSTGFGGFGTSTTPAAGGGLFGAAAPAPATGAFGAPAPAPAAGAFGGFGTTGGAFGASAAQQGTGNPPWRQTRAEDPGKSANPGMLMSISAMKEYVGKSHEELRLEDYLQNRKNSSAVTAAPASTGFGGISLGGTAAPASGGLFGGFGATPAPAAPTTTAFSFGAPAPAPSSFGGFGAAAPTPAPTPAGGFTGFGATAAPAAGGLFGTQAPAPAAAGAFGSTAGGFSFGATPAPAAGSGFGGFGVAAAKPAPAAGGLFGAAPAPAGGFTFGAAPAAPTPAPATFGSTFGFGSTPAPAAPAPGAFSFGGATAGAPAAGGFGAPAPAPAGGLFGATSTGGLFGSTAAPAATTGGFTFAKPATPSPAPATGGFSFGGTAGTFGTPAKSVTFGAPAPAAGGLFGVAAPAPSAFSFGGSTPTPAPAPTSGFGSFGSFGSAAPATTSAFGTPTPAGGIFGATAATGAGGVFSSTAQQQQQPQQQHFAMHNQDPYGATTQPGFGSGALEQKIMGVERSSKQLVITFERNSGANPLGVGAADQAGGSSGSGGRGPTGASVGNAPPSIGFAYRRTPRSSARIRPRGLAGAGDIPGAGADGGNSAMLPPSSSRLLSEGALTPGGGGGKSRGVLSPDVYLSAGVKRLIIPPSNMEDRPPRFSGARSLIKSSSGDGAGAAGGGGGRRRISADDRDRGATGVGGSRSGFGGSGGGGAEETKRGEGGSTATVSTPAYGNGNGNSIRNGGPAGPTGNDGVMAGGLSSPDGSTRRSGGGGGRSSSALADIVSPPPSGSVGTDVRAAAGGGGGDESLLDEGGSPSAGGDGGGGGGGGGGGLFDVEGDTDVGVGGTSFPPTLDMEGYETTPPMSELVAMDENSLRSVTGFKVSRPGYGSIEWKEPVDLRRVDIGLVVVIEFKSASVYDELPENEEKPPRGEGLNKSTTVTLLGVFPKGDNPSEEQKRKYEQKVRRNTEKIGAVLVEYSADTGVWVFDTLHWSRYAMDDSDDDEEGGDVKAKAASGAASKLMPPPPPLGPSGRIPRAATATRGQRQPRRSTKYSMPDTDDEGSVADNASDAGGITGNMAATAGGRGDGTTQAGNVEEDADMADVDYAPPATGGATGESKEEYWAEPRLPTNNLFRSAMDTEQAENLRVAVGHELVDSRGYGGTREAGGGAGYLAGTTLPPERVPILQRSLWEPLVGPRGITPPPVLGDAEDAKAAAAFRPVVSAANSRVLRVLANAWETEDGELKDEAARGVVRAGKIVADSGLRRGRGFRASWGPGGKLVLPGTIGGSKAVGGGVRGSLGRHTVHIRQFDPMPTASARDAGELYVETLSNHQQFAQPVDCSSDAAETATDEDVPPRWVLPQRNNRRPENYKALVRCMHGYAAAHAAIASRGDKDDVSSSPEWVLEQMWRLASAMWGQEEGEGKVQDLPLPGEEPPCGEPDGDIGSFGGSSSGGASPASRREAAVADWLANAVSICVPAVPKGDDPWQNLLELLSVRRVDDAANLAAKSGLPRLAVVLAAVAAVSGQGGVSWPGAHYASNALAKQVKLWQAGGADARMPQEAFVIYQLLGRERFRDVQLRGLIGSKRAGPRHRSLDWLRQLGLCLWFGAGAPSSNDGSDGVAEAVEAFESLVADKEALPPTARYLREATHHREEDLENACAELRTHYFREEDSGRDRCVLNRLLALYPPRIAGGGGGASAVVGRTALLAALEPLAVSPDAIDYRHSWHLMTVVEALDVTVVLDRCTAAAVAESLRFQLVIAGLWEWAVYVALSAEEGSGRREATARELVMRYGHGLLAAAAESVDGKRRHLLSVLGIPGAWLYESAAVRAGYDHKAALPAPTGPCALDRKSTPGRVGGGGWSADQPVPDGVEAELNREAKLGLLVSAGSSRLAPDAARELCQLAPISLYLGRKVGSLAVNFEEISRRLEMEKHRGRGRALADGFGGDGGGGGRTKEFDAYAEMLDIVHRGPVDGDVWTRDEVDRLRRVRIVAERAAARVVGRAVAHEALSTLLRGEGLPAE